MAKGREDLNLAMAEKTLLIHDLLRQAPAYLRDPSKLPLTSLEDFVSLFDAQSEEPAYLPHAILVYHMEAYNDLVFDKSQRTKIDSIDSSFVPTSIQKQVESIYMVDKQLNSAGHCEQEVLVPHVLALLDSDLIRTQSLLKALIAKG